MKIIFNIGYRTNWGESVYIVGDIEALGNGDYAKALKLHLDGNDHWSISIDTPADMRGFNYHYFVRNDDGAVKNEWGHGNCFTATDEGTYRIYDRWQDQPFDKPFYSSLFTECVYRQTYQDGKVSPTRGFVLFEVAAPMVGRRQRTGHQRQQRVAWRMGPAESHTPVKRRLPTVEGQHTGRRSRPRHRV